MQKLVKLLMDSFFVKTYVEIIQRNKNVIQKFG